VNSKEVDVKHRLAVLLAALMLASCGYTVSDEVLHGQAVATVQAPSANFSQYTTFTVATTVQVHDNTTGNPADSTKDAPMLAQHVADIMTSRGFTAVPFTNGVVADLVIAFDAYLGSTAYGGYWCNWYYWGYPYGCYPYYAGSYQFGTLVMSMGDRKNAAPGGAMNTVWAAAMYGVLGTQSYNVQIVQTSIDRAFAQSPYIHK
jgi:hypothetical protein